jgi:hypothetical protein
MKNPNKTHTMIDFTGFARQDLYNIVKNNPVFIEALQNSDTMDEVISVLDNMDIKYNDAQLMYLKNKVKDKIPNE